MRHIIIGLFLSSCLSLLNSCQKESSQIIENLKPPVADAGDSQTIELPKVSVTLTGSGSTQNGKIIGYLWSLVSGPNVPILKTPSSPTSIVNGLISGTYTFQFAVIDSAGLTGVDTTSLVVSPAPIQTIIIQPGNNTSNELNFAVRGNQNVSAHDIDLDAAAWTNGGEAVFLRGAFKFDLSGIPANVTIISAKLSLYSNPTPINGNLIDANSGSNNAMYIRRISSDWNGITATWQTQPFTENIDQILIPHTNLSSLDLININVKNLISTMISTNNYGFMIRLQNENPYTIRQFASSNHPNDLKRPKLEIVYQ